MSALSDDGEGERIHTVELYRKVRLACRDGMSERAAARHFGVSRESVRKMLAFSVPPGYRRTAPVRRPKLDGFTGLIDEWLRGDRKEDRRKQRHTAKRIFERLRDEHGFTGGYTIVKDYVREHRRRRREMYVPLVHPPGHGQADFGEAWAFIGGVTQKVHFFAFDLPHSDASYVRAYPAATAEAWVPEGCQRLLLPVLTAVRVVAVSASIGAMRMALASHAAQRPPGSLPSGPPSRPPSGPPRTPSGPGGPGPLHR